MTKKNLCIKLTHPLKKNLLAWLILLTTTGCQEGEIGGAVGVHLIGGTVSGLTDGQKVVLQNNGKDPLTVTANGNFEFPTPIPFGEKYSITVKEQPSLDYFRGCSVLNGTGVIKANMNNIYLGCGPIVSTFAGSGNSKSNDGEGTSASFEFPRGIIFDKSGNAYVADRSRIRKIDPRGNVTTFAGSDSIGYVDGEGVNASFDDVVNFAFDEKDNLYATDIGNNAIRRIDHNRNVTTFATIDSPGGIAIDKEGNFYVAQFEKNLISKIDPKGKILKVIGSGNPGDKDGIDANSDFNGPYGLAFDSKNELYVADTRNHKIRKISADGYVKTFVGTGYEGSTDGQGIAASFNNPTNIVFDAEDNLYVTDMDNNKIRKIDSDGKVTSSAGTGSAGDTDGRAHSASFDRPTGINFDNNRKSLYVSDSYGYKIRKISRGFINP